MNLPKSTRWTNNTSVLKWWDDFHEECGSDPDEQMMDDIYRSLGLDDDGDQDCMDGVNKLVELFPNYVIVWQETNMSMREFLQKKGISSPSLFLKFVIEYLDEDLDFFRQNYAAYYEKHKTMYKYTISGKINLAQIKKEFEVETTLEKMPFKQALAKKIFENIEIKCQ